MPPELVRRYLERPRDFLYGGDNKEMFITWSIGPTIDYRDADTARRAQGEAKLRSIRNRFKEGEDFKVERFSHFLVGWVEHLTFRVIDNKDDLTSVTKIAKAIQKGSGS